MADEVRANRRSRSRDDVERSRRKTELGGELGHAQSGERRRRVRLEDDGAPCSQRGRQLPRGHHQRVVPRNDLSRDSHRLLQRVEEERAADRVRPARDRRDRRSVEAKVLDPLCELRFHRGDRLAHVAGLELGKLLSVCLNRIRECMQQARALGRRRLTPLAGEGGSRGLDGAVDVLFASRRDPGERFPGRGLGQLSNVA